MFVAGGHCALWGHEHARQKLVERRPGARHRGAADLDLEKLLGAVGRHGCLHSNLHAGERADLVGPVAAPSDIAGVPGQCDRAGADAADRGDGHRHRYSISGAAAHLVRAARGAGSSAGARLRGLRLVRHQHLDRWLGDLCRAQHRLERRTMPAHRCRCWGSTRHSSSASCCSGRCISISSGTAPSRSAGCRCCRRPSCW